MSASTKVDSNAVFSDSSADGATEENKSKKVLSASLYQLDTLFESTDKAEDRVPLTLSPSGQTQDEIDFIHLVIDFIHLVSQMQAILQQLGINLTVTEADQQVKQAQLAKFLNDVAQQMKADMDAKIDKASAPKPWWLQFISIALMVVSAIAAITGGPLGMLLAIATTALISSGGIDKAAKELSTAISKAQEHKKEEYKQKLLHSPDFIKQCEKDGVNPEDKAEELATQHIEASSNFLAKMVIALAVVIIIAVVAMVAPEALFDVLIKLAVSEGVNMLLATNIASDIVNMNTEYAFEHKDAAGNLTIALQGVLMGLSFLSSLSMARSNNSSWGAFLDQHKGTLITIGTAASALAMAGNASTCGVQADKLRKQAENMNDIADLKKALLLCNSSIESLQDLLKDSNEESIANDEALKKQINNLNELVGKIWSSAQ